MGLYQKINLESANFKNVYMLSLLVILCFENILNIVT